MASQTKGIASHAEAMDTHAQATAKHEEAKIEWNAKFQNLIADTSYTFSKADVSTKQNGEGVKNDADIEVTRCLVIKTGNSSNKTHFKAISGATEYTIDGNRLKLTKGTWCNKTGNDRWFYKSGTLWLTPNTDNDLSRLRKLFAEAGIQPTDDDATKQEVQKLFQPQGKTSEMLWNYRYRHSLCVVEPN